MHNITKLLTLGFLAVSACSNPAEKALAGKWQGYELLEEGEALPLDPSEISFEFGADRTYAFSGTLNYREAGLFRIQGEYLFTRDTMSEGSVEKAVLLSDMSPDTLILKMREGEKDRVLKLRRFRESGGVDENHPAN
jgi:hypothetical protein